MNENIHSNSPANAPWLSKNQRVEMPDTSLLSDSEKVVPAAVGLLDNAVQGAHDTVDRMAAGAEPVVRHLGDNVASAAKALQAKTDQLRVTRDEWAESARVTVRGNPLVTVAAAFTLGAVISRLLKSSARRNG